MGRPVSSVTIFITTSIEHGPLAGNVARTSRPFDQIYIYRVFLPQASLGPT